MGYVLRRIQDQRMAPWAVALLLAAACAAPLPPRPASVETHAPARSSAEVWPLASFDFTFEKRAPADQVALLAARGYHGVAVGRPDVAALRALRKVPAVADGSFQVVTALRYEKLAQPLARAELEALTDELAALGAFLWVMFDDGPAAQEAIVQRVRELADIAASRGVTLVLYPHAGTALLTSEQALDWLKAADRPNIKLSLHLCHELKARNHDRMSEVIARVVPHLAVVTLNGADREVPPKGWERTIRPLDRGDFDVRSAFFEPLARAGYRGPVVLHTFGLADPPEQHLERSMNVWRRWTEHTTAMLPNAMGAFTFTLEKQPIDEQISLLRRSGYTAAVLPWPDASRVRAYLDHPDVRAGRFSLDAILFAIDGAINERWLGALLGAIRGHREVQLWMTVDGLDGEALTSAVRTVAERAAAQGTRLVLYPHDGSKIPSAEDALRIIRATGRDDVRLALHLSHEMKAGNRDRLDEVIRRTVSYAAAATINGSETMDGRPTGDFDRLILPLGRGDFDVRERWLRPLIAAGYRGSITLHTWGVKQPPVVHLRESMSVWKTMSVVVADETRAFARR